MDASRRLWPRADLRVGDSDRQAVIAELQRHFIDGRLTSDELGERVSQALSARTFADFSPLLADLPRLPEPASADTRVEAPADWQTRWLSPPIGAVLILIGILALMWLLVLTHMRGGFFPFPMFLFALLFVSLPFRGRRRY